jgi:hypothetical protein
LGEGLSPKYRLYAPCSLLVTLQICFGCPFLGLLWDCSHYALFVDAMDLISLGEALSPIAWATDVVFSVAALLASCFD